MTEIEFLRMFFALASGIFLGSFAQSNITPNKSVGVGTLLLAFASLFISFTVGP